MLHESHELAMPRPFEHRMSVLGAIPGNSPSLPHLCMAAPPMAQYGAPPRLSQEEATNVPRIATSVYGHPQLGLGFEPPSEPSEERVRSPAARKPSAPQLVMVGEAESVPAPAVDSALEPAVKGDAVTDAVGVATSSAAPAALPASGTLSHTRKLSRPIVGTGPSRSKASGRPGPKPHPWVTTSTSTVTDVTLPPSVIDDNSRQPLAAIPAPSLHDAWKMTSRARQGHVDAQSRSARSGLTREEVVELVQDLAKQHHIFNDRFVLLNRAPQQGSQGCVHVAVDKDRDHERVAVKTFFRSADFSAESSLYVNEDVTAQAILPHLFVLGAWDKVWQNPHSSELCDVKGD